VPSDPTTPLDPERLASILHGDAEVGDEGRVTVTIDRSDTIVIDDIQGCKSEVRIGSPSAPSPRGRLGRGRNVVDSMAGQLSQRHRRCMRVR
jgi:hypothetical protein